MKSRLGIVVAVLLAGLGMAVQIVPATGQGSNASKVQFARDIQPILASNCFLCHGPDEKVRKAGLRLDVREVALKPTRSGARPIVPGNVNESELITRIFSNDSDRMPPAKSHKPLKDSEKELLKRWIAEGAEYQKHWAFVAPQRPPLPEVKDAGWTRNAIDHFVLARLDKLGLQPSPEADRYTLARRVALDLTGLPPSLDAVDRFVNDASPLAYEKFVDHLLALPSFGERWAGVWLDLARYADSQGYATDNPRSIWKYRDWVIDAINKNMPFDQFTIEQIAGDLLPNPTIEQLLATAFHRNTLTNDEGGTDDEEFRVAAVVDRVNTTLQVWMGLTIGCAQCHDHKYDPIGQEEYFKVYAIFNQTQDSDKADNQPVLATPTPEQQQQKTAVEQKLREREDSLRQGSGRLYAAVGREMLRAASGIASGIGMFAGPPPPTAAQIKQLAADVKTARDQVAALKKQSNAIKILSTPIMRELDEKQLRKTKIHIRGNFLDQGKEVTPGVPAALLSLHAHGRGSVGAPPPNRLDLARWLVDPANPLTARVTVNRLWEQVFGIGLVETPEDWGIRGKLPHHPQLLDWLATEFMAQKWDVKQMLRLIVTSAAYRQSSRATPAVLQRDPNNLLFARGPRFRSSAEMVRDQALHAASLLSKKMYGEPVRPPRPKLGLTAAFGGATDWEPSPGDDKYRRAVYTFVRRSAPYPSMTTFDAPDRNVCTLTRPRTNTPLQALVTLNDPCYVEAAQALGRRMVQAGGATPESKVAHGFRLCVTRPPSASEVRRLVELYEKARAEYAAKPNEAQLMATEPLGPLPPGLDAVDLAAWTVVGNVLLNLDEVFTKR